MSTKIISSIEIEALSKLYTITKPDKVVAFLNENVFLVPVLLDEYSKIREFYPKENLFLEVFHDPAAPAPVHLTIWIDAKFEENDPFAKLHQLDHEWDAHLPPYVMEKLHTNLGSL